MVANPRAGQPAQPEDLVDLPHLVTAYYSIEPDPDDVAQQVAFGTSGHRGSALNGAFNEAHILAITQAIVEYRAAHGTTGPLFIGRDTHGLSEPAWVSALEVLAANDVVAMIDSGDRYTPTPAVSHAILTYNRGRTEALADGIVVTPSHNPPRRRRLQVQPAQRRPGRHRRDRRNCQARQRDSARRLAAVKRVPLARALQSRPASRLHGRLRRRPAERGRHRRDPRGRRSGSAPTRWAGPAWTTGARSPSGIDLDLTVVNPLVDATWRFMTLDHDGKIRMDCSSPDAMASLIANRDHYQIATGNDADSDRHGIVTPDEGLLNPNHYLAVAIDYLFTHRPDWPARHRGRQDRGQFLDHRPGGGRHRPRAGRGAGRVQVVRRRPDRRAPSASAARSRQGRRFCAATDRCGPPTRTASSWRCWRRRSWPSPVETPSQRYQALTAEYGTPSYARVDAPADREQKARLAKLSAEQVTATELAGEPITAKLTAAPGNGAPLGGLKVTTANAWFAARPSGTEDVYKIYAESFNGPEHLAEVQKSARKWSTRSSDRNLLVRWVRHTSHISPCGEGLSDLRIRHRMRYHGVPHQRL